MKSESEVTQSCPTLSDPMTTAHQAPPSMVFSRQEYWSGVPLPSPDDPTTVLNILCSINNYYQLDGFPDAYSSAAEEKVLAQLAWGDNQPSYES